MDNDGGLKKVYDPNAERILRMETIENNMVVFYTVPIAHNLYLEEASISLEISDNINSGFVYINWFTDGMAYVRDLCQIWIWADKLGVPVGMTVGDHAVFPSGLFLPAGHMVAVTSSRAGMIAEGSFSGFLVSDYA